MKTAILLRLLLLVTAFGGCSAGADVETSESAAPASGSSGAGAAAPAEPAELREAELASTEHVHVVGNIYLAGQPQQDELDELASRGVKTIVSLRKPEELDWDEAAAVEAAGMEFVAIPFGDATELTDDVFKRVRQVLAERADQPLVLHCARANRVGAVWMVHRVLNEGVGVDQALAEAKTAGLRTPEFVARAQDFIRRAQEANEDGTKAANTSPEP